MLELDQQVALAAAPMQSHTSPAILASGQLLMALMDALLHHADIPIFWELVQGSPTWL